jgi:hypothetical protein
MARSRSEAAKKAAATRAANKAAKEAKEKAEKEVQHPIPRSNPWEFETVELRSVVVQSVILLRDAKGKAIGEEFPVRSNPMYDVEEAVDYAKGIPEELKSEEFNARLRASLMPRPPGA